MRDWSTLFTFGGYRCITLWILLSSTELHCFDIRISVAECDDIRCLVDLIVSFWTLRIVSKIINWNISFSNFESSSGGKFKYYSIFVLGVGSFCTIVSFVILFVSDTLIFHYLCILFLVLSCASCFYLTAKKIYEMTGTAMDFGHKRFSLEQQRWVFILSRF